MIVRVKYKVSRPNIKLKSHTAVRSALLSNDVFGILSLDISLSVLIIGESWVKTDFTDA